MWTKNVIKLQLLVDNKINILQRNPFKQSILSIYTPLSDDI